MIEARHITRDDLAEQYGKPLGVITKTLRQNSIFAVGLLCSVGRKNGVPHYEKDDAVRALDAAFVVRKKEPDECGQIVPPRQPMAFRPEIDD